MGLDYLAEDQRFVGAAALGATWGSVFAFELIRRKFRAMFALSGAATAYLAYEANAQLKAHKAFHRAKHDHDSIQNQRIALIAQTQRLVPISEDAHILQINRVRKLLERGLVPFIVTINDLNGLKNSLHNNGNEIKLLWIRSDFHDNNMYFSYGEINPLINLRVVLAAELKSDIPVIIEKECSSFVLTDKSLKDVSALSTGEEAIAAALSSIPRLGKDFWE